MAQWTRVSLLLTTLVTVGVGCPNNPPSPPTDVPDADVSSPDADVPAPGDVVDVVMPDGDVPDVFTCPSVEFVRPAPSAVLGMNDGTCATGGFTYNVQVATSAQTGTMLELYGNGRMLAQAVVNSPTVRFDSVVIDPSGMTTLTIRVAGESMSCATAAVTVNCAVPRCQITAPDHSTLNLADNVASMGMPFATNFTVGTDVEDGQMVELAVTGMDTPLRAAVMAGVARFNAVALSPDGDFRLRATCRNRANNVGQSSEARFTVDSTAPTLTVSSPMAGAVIGMMSDVNATRAGNQFRVCGRSNNAGRDLCAVVAGAMPGDGNCTPVPTSATTDACVEVTCPDGGAPFDVEVSTSDAAGNRTRQTLAGIRCQSALPSVRIVAPRAFDAADPTTALRVTSDLDAMTPGLQVDVVACVDRMAGMATLTGASTTATATVAAAVGTDPCGMLGMGFTGIARFPRVTLLDSNPVRSISTDPAPTNPVIRVSVTDPAGDVGASSPQTLYVDSVPPQLNIFNCGRLLRPTETDGSAIADVTISSDSFPVTLTLERTGDMTRTLTLPSATGTGGTGRFMAVRFAPGTTNLRLNATDPAGNVGMTSAACTAVVGNPPTLAFTAPTMGAVFTGSRTLTVTLTTDAPAGTVVTLTLNGASPVTSTVVGTTVTFTNVTLPEADAVALTATTAEVTGRGVGTATVSVVVDTQRPSTPTALMLSVPTTPAAARRAGTVRLSWNDAGDPNPSGSGTRAVARYDIRFSTNPIADVAAFTAATALTVTVTPGTPGTANRADATGVQLERPTYFAMRAFDAAGNASATVISAGPITIPLVIDQLSNAAPPLGNSVSGGFDVNGDGFFDLVTGSGTYTSGTSGLARIYFGSATGLSATNFAEFRGLVATNRFGTAVASLGDVNGDGIGDIAIGEPGPTSGTLIPGSIYIYFGRATWRTGSATPYTPTDASVTIGNGTGEMATARLGAILARVGDFDGDGLNDVVGAGPVAGTVTATTGGAVVLFRGRRTWPATLTPANADATFRNPGPLTFFGGSMAGVGRLVGNDNREDLAIGNGTSGTAGALYVFAGRDLSTPVTLTLTDAAFTRAGIMSGSMPTPGFTAGNAQVVPGAVGDIDGDGRTDMVIGQNGQGSGAGYGGEVFVYLGNASGGLTAATNLVNTTTSVATDQFGRAFASIYDPTRIRPSLLLGTPSAADLLVGSAGYIAGPPRFYLFRGRPGTEWATISSINAEKYIDVPGTTSSSINTLAWIGDVDGDGYVDAAFGQSSNSGVSGSTVTAPIYILR